MKIFSKFEVSPFLEEIKNFVPRDGVNQIIDFCNDRLQQKVCVVTGLRHTGKTTMLLQALASVSRNQNAIYIDVEKDDEIVDLEENIERLFNLGFRVFFVDDVTYLPNFINKSKMFSDDYPLRGMRFVISGSNPIMFKIASTDVLYDRMVEIKTGWMSFDEYKRVIDGSFDDYIQHGGIFIENDAEYVNTAICKSLVDSLSKNQDYSDVLKINKQLENFVFRVLMNEVHDFINQSLWKDTKTSQYLKKFPENDFLPTFECSDSIIEVQNWLTEMDVLCKKPFYKSQKGFLLLSPAFIQVRKVVDSLDLFNTFHDNEFANKFRKVMLEAINDRIVKDIVFTNALMTLKNSDVFVWDFKKRLGEFDLVIADKGYHDPECDIFEISENPSNKWEQAKHLRYAPWLEIVDKRYILKHRVVLYPGKDSIDFDGVMWLNIESFLQNLQDYRAFLDKKYEELSKKRVAYDELMTSWACSHLENIEETVNQWLAETSEIPFANWVFDNVCRFPWFQGKYLEINPGEKIECFGSSFTWDGLQCALAEYKALPRVGSFEEWIHPEGPKMV